MAVKSKIFSNQFPALISKGLIKSECKVSFDIKLGAPAINLNLFDWIFFKDV